MFAIAAAIFACLAFLVLPVIVSVYRRRKVLQNVPGLEETWVLGHAKHFMNKPPPVILKTVQEGFRKCGKVWKAFLAHDTLVLVSDPKIMEVGDKSQIIILDSKPS